VGIDCEGDMFVRDGGHAQEAASTERIGFALAGFVSLLKGDVSHG
jgi:hypothetical protein